MFVGVLLLALGIVFLVAGFTGWPRSVIGVESEQGPTSEGALQDTPEGLLEGALREPAQSTYPAIPTSRRLSTICLGFVGLFFGIVSVLANAD
ncbi:MAG: hypothetical protein FJ020_05555 [Chloroflexi bacterium]|nr:hypothetical protein [Chloroflexota bacterium]